MTDDTGRGRPRGRTGGDDRRGGGGGERTPGATARQYYEDLPEHEMSYAEAFGEEPEDA